MRQPGEIWTECLILEANQSKELVGIVGIVGSSVLAPSFRFARAHVIILPLISVFET